MRSKFNIFVVLVIMSLLTACSSKDKDDGVISENVVDSNNTETDVSNEDNLITKITIDEDGNFACSDGSIDLNSLDDLRTIVSSCDIDQSRDFYIIKDYDTNNDSSVRIGHNISQLGEHGRYLLADNVEILTYSNEYLYLFDKHVLYDSGDELYYTEKRLTSGIRVLTEEIPMSYRDYNTWKNTYAFECNDLYLEGDNRYTCRVFAVMHDGERFFVGETETDGVKDVYGNNTMAWSDVDSIHLTNGIEYNNLIDNNVTIDVDVIIIDNNSKRYILADDGVIDIKTNEIIDIARKRQDGNSVIYYTPFGAISDSSIKSTFDGLAENYKLVNGTSIPYFFDSENIKYSEREVLRRLITLDYKVLADDIGYYEYTDINNSSKYYCDYDMVLKYNRLKWFNIPYNTYTLDGYMVFMTKNANVSGVGGFSGKQMLVVSYDGTAYIRAENGDGNIILIRYEMPVRQANVPKIENVVDQYNAFDKILKGYTKVESSGTIGEDLTFYDVWNQSNQ